jgi:hypothetical protein
MEQSERGLWWRVEAESTTVTSNEQCWILPGVSATSSSAEGDSFSVSVAVLQSLFPSSVEAEPKRIQRDEWGVAARWIWQGHPTLEQERRRERACCFCLKQSQVLCLAPPLWPSAVVHCSPP